MLVPMSTGLVQASGVAPPWDVSNLSILRSEDVSVLNANLFGVTLNEYATSMYTMDFSDDTIHQYSLSTAYDISSAASASKSHVVGGSPTNMVFSADGSKLFFNDLSTDDIEQVDLSTEYDISTGSNSSDNISHNSQDGQAFDNEVQDTGDRIYIVGNTSDSVHQWDLSTPFDLTTASYDTSFSVSSQTTLPTGLAIHPSGEQMVICAGTGIFYQYSLSTPWDIGTASYDTVSKDLSGSMGNVRGIHAAKNGLFLYVADNTGTEIHQLEF